MNSIYLRRKRKIVISKSKFTVDETYIATALVNIESLGYTLSDDLLLILKTHSIEEIETVYTKLVEDIKEMVGAHVQYKPMYPNFPKQVIEASDDELYTNAILHYLGNLYGARIMPDYKKKRRPKLKDTVTPKIIQLGTVQEFEEIFTNLMKSKTGLSPQDKQDIEWFVKTYKNEIYRLIPDEIPLKENIGLLGALLILHTDKAGTFLEMHCKTATDVLRIAVAYSEGDVSLAEKTRFKKMSKPVRRLLLSLLEQCSNRTEDMLRYKEYWKRLGEVLHPGEYKARFPNTFSSFDVIRNKLKFETYHSKIEQYIFEKNTDSLLKELSKRPGELARKLDLLLRNAQDVEPVLKTFRSVAENVSTPVLLQVLTHFKYRNRNKDLRVFFPKGNVGKLHAETNTLPKLDDKARQEVVTICKNTLRTLYGKRKPLGNVYIDKQLKRYTVPFALRSASKALKTVARGSEFELPPGDTIRFFIWWKDGNDRTDIDLSMLALDTQHKPLATIAYYNLREMGGHHSGDITSAPNGASEFIDISIEQLRQGGIRYIHMVLNSFTQQPYSDLPECFAGFMRRQFPNSGEVYDPKTVENKVDITANTRMCIPFIIDLETRKVIWTDIALAHMPGRANNVAANLSGITVMSKAMMELVKPTLYELFTLHAEARGTSVLSKKTAKTVFSVEDGITPFDTELIIAEYL
ncbi:MAG: TerD family protein [Patescibacteria group bacterium]